jgi:hypothetical protein
MSSGFWRSILVSVGEGGRREEEEKEHSYEGYVNESMGEMSSGFWRSILGMWREEQKRIRRRSRRHSYFGEEGGRIRRKRRRHSCFGEEGGRSRTG